MLGEAAEMIFEGIQCEQCGCLLDDDGEALGYPASCDVCE